MPQGDRRGTNYEFYDWTYDGEWKGENLHNGLGCLTDGDFGPENFKLSYYAQREYHFYFLPASNAEWVMDCPVSKS